MKSFREWVQLREAENRQGRRFAKLIDDDGTNLNRRYTPGVDDHEPVTTTPTLSTQVPAAAQTPAAATPGRTVSQPAPKPAAATSSGPQTIDPDHFDPTEPQYMKTKRRDLRLKRVQDLIMKVAKQKYGEKAGFSEKELADLGRKEIMSRFAEIITQHGEAHPAAKGMYKMYMDDGELSMRFQKIIRDIRKQQADFSNQQG